MPSSTPARPCRGDDRMRAGALTIEVGDTEPGSQVTGHRAAGTGWPGCASGPPYSAVSWPPGRSRRRVCRARRLPLGGAVPPGEPS